jgi:hypothetical protein
MKNRALLVILTLASQSTSLNAQSPPPEAGFLTSASGCKFVNPFPDEEPPPVIDWSGECVDGFVSGQGDVIVSGRRATMYHGAFERGQIKVGSATRSTGTYEGEFKDNRPHGQGVLTYANGRYLKASFVDGKPQGDFVELKFPNGSRYEGQMNIETSAMEGKGSLFYSDGSTYEGMFRDDHPEGPGVMKLSSGEVRRGEFVHGQLHGKGSIEWSNGTRYEGELQGEKPHGRGRLEWAGGGHYEGDFAGGLQQGKGKLVHSNGDAYEGDFLASHPHGQGTYRFASGDVYEGAFVGGQRHGQGRLTYQSGVVQEGEWRQGYLHGKCRINSPNDVYEGECIAGHYSGYGRLERRARGEVYEGEFRNGSYDGKGKLSDRDHTYEGTFKLGLKEGIGRETFSNGNEYEGSFVQDLRHGRGIIKARTADGQEVVYDGELSSGILEGSGVLTVGSKKLEGRFKGGVFVQGLISGDNRTFEIDIEKDQFSEILPDGTKQALDEMPVGLGI